MLRFVFVFFLTIGSLAAEQPLQSISGCTLVQAPWADGDSFPVHLPDGRTVTVRLYGADCIEWHVNDETDARRLRAQRRYFGIGGDDANASMAKAKSFGELAGKRTRELLMHVAVRLRKDFTVLLLPPKEGITPPFLWKRA
jgi:hypothetical protein